MGVSSRSAGRAPAPIRVNMSECYFHDLGREGKIG